MMKTPKVTVIVPVYNAEKTLVRCLDSLIAQTYKEKEIVLINDGSTDNSRAICEQYSHNWPCITLINQKNAGPATARNVGIDYAKSKYLSFVDSDDYVENDMLESMVSTAEENQVEMVICGYYKESVGKSSEHKFKYTPGLYKGDDVRNIAIELINDVSEGRIPPYSWIRMVRGDVLENPRIRYADGMVRSEDYYFYVQVHFRIKSLYLLVDKPLYHYMEVNDSITHKYVGDCWNSVKEIYFGLKKQFPEQWDIHYRLDIMFLRRSLIALNNSARAVDKKLFKKELYEIVRNYELNKAVKRIPIRDGTRLIGAYYILLRTKAYLCIYMRYLYKFYRKRLIE